MNMEPRSVIERFWSGVEKRTPEKCWPWTGSKMGKGYGAFDIWRGAGRQRVRTSSHRLSFKIAFGPFDERLHVLHCCDNPACVNPSHLFLGTNLDNIHDAMSKGRVAHGENHWASKLTMDQAEEIRRLRSLGMSYGQLGKQFGVHRMTIVQITKGECWKKV